MSGRRRGGGEGFVYSTQHGELCPGCGQPKASCTCPAHGDRSAGDGVVRVARETKGRKGKGVTLVTGVPLPPAELAKLGKELKKKCGTGGTVRGAIIEIQGDHRDRLVTELRKRGWAVKRVGG